MPLSAITQRRTHNLLLLQKLLNLRDGASPFTLLLDTLEQSARPVVQEFIVRAKASKTKIIFVSHQTLRKPNHVDVFIPGRKKQLAALSQEIVSALPAIQPPSSTASSKALLIFDTLNHLAITASPHLSSFFSSFLSPTTSVLATYHTDVPIPTNTQLPDPYAPGPLTTLLYLATAILQISSLPHAIEKKRARDRSLQEPNFGLQEGREGVLMGMKGPRQDGMEGVVIDVEIRRKSGRGVRETFVLSNSFTTFTSAGGSGQSEALGTVCLLDDHPLCASPLALSLEGEYNGAEGNGQDEVETTFSLGLTEKQRRDREGVVLPYFDAQEGSGEGGRILYEMDRGDDFDEEEDEI